MSVFQNVVGVGIGLVMYLVYLRLFGQLSANQTTSLANTPRIGDLPSGMSPADACLILKKKYAIEKREKLLELSPSVTFHWMNMQCEKYLPFTVPVESAIGSGQSVEHSQQPSHTIAGDILHKITDTIAHIRHPDADQAELDTTTSTGTAVPVAHSSAADNHAQERCKEMVVTHHVVPGSSWGTLPEMQQREWTRLHCDQVDLSSVQSITGGSTSVIGETIVGDPAPTTAEDVEKLVKKRKPGKDGKLAPQENTALPNIDPGHAEWCLSNRDRYGVQPMKSWGRLPQNMIDMWKMRKCDLTFTAARMLKRPLPKCFGNETVVINPSTGAIATAAVSGKSKQPLIAIMAATTTRKVIDPSTSNMALFTYLLPSLIRTIECGFRYEYVLGYDVGDPFYDTDEGMSKTKAWFRSNIEEPMQKNGISIKMRPVKFHNTMKKPGPVFIAMARAAYEAGADYYYRVNDDTELLASWPVAFVKAVHSMPAPFGVVGPICNQGNQKILTHDFVHRTHMDVFGMNYYPPQLVDWWMDDWISLVYGKKRTFKAKNVPVMHHTGAHGQRYEVDRSNEKLLTQLVIDGRKSIRAWMLKHSVPETELAAFDKDEFRAGFDHLDIPNHLKVESDYNHDGDQDELVGGKNKHKMHGGKRNRGAFRKIKQYSEHE